MAGYFDEETAQVIASPGVDVDQVVEKLVDLGVPTTVIKELSDSERLP